MIFQGKELHIGDKLVSKRHGEIKVENLLRSSFVGELRDGTSRFWEYTGKYADVTNSAIDATWPDAAPDAEPAPDPEPAPDLEAEYRRIWLERAGAIFDKESGFASDGRCDARLAFDAADMFLAELRKRDGEGK